MYKHSLEASVEAYGCKRNQTPVTIEPPVAHTYVVRTCIGMKRLQGPTEPTANYVSKIVPIPAAILYVATNEKTR